MANNCLVTKLKGVVNNNTLPVLGYATIVTTSLSSSYPTKIRTTAVSKIKVIGGTVNGQTEITPTVGTDVTIVLSTVVSDGTFGAGRVGLLVKNNEILYLEFPYNVDAGSIRFSNIIKLSLNYANIVNTNYLASIFAYRNFESLDARNIASADGVADVTELGANGRVTQIRMTGSKCFTGSLDKSGKSPLQRLDVPTTKDVSLNINNFVAYNRGADRNTGSLTLPYLDKCNAAFSGGAIQHKESNSLSWTATTITLDGVEVNDDTILT